MSGESNEHSVPGAEEMEQRLRFWIGQLHSRAPESIGDLLRFRVGPCSPDAGEYRFYASTGDWMKNAFGSLHGGIIGTILDQGMGMLATCLMDSKAITPTVQMNVTYHRPLMPGDEIQLIPYCARNRISLSVPSLRADNFSRELMEKLQTVRKSGLTFAPEAGTQRLRDVINKNLQEEEILSTCARAFAGGWSNVKLYFMLGLPTETDEDVLGIAELVYKIIQAWKENGVNKKRGLRVHVATAYFVPKPHTPFQWEQQITPQEYLRRCKLLKDHFYSKSIEYDYHSVELSTLEAVFARGDRRLGAVIEEAVKHGAKLDGWDEYFDYGKWHDAFVACGIPEEFYTTRGYGEQELLPWDVIDVGVTKKFLLKERKLAYQSQVTPDCRHGCAGCGATSLLKEVECDA